MFVHIFGILFGYGLLIALVWWLPSYLGYGRLGAPPWGIRLPVIRDQLITVIATIATSKLLFAFNLFVMGKLATGGAGALTIYFVWEDISNWSSPPLSGATRRIGAIVVLALISLSFISVFM